MRARYAFQQDATIQGHAPEAHQGFGHYLVLGEILKENLVGASSIQDDISEAQLNY